MAFITDYIPRLHRVKTSNLARSSDYREVQGPETVYHVSSALATEAEIDVLTGERRINRVDIAFDCGERCLHCCPMYFYLCTIMTAS